MLYSDCYTSLFLSITNNLNFFKSRNIHIRKSRNTDYSFGLYCTRADIYDVKKARSSANKSRAARLPNKNGYSHFIWIKSGGLWVSPTVFLAMQEYSPTCPSASTRRVNELEASKIPALTSCSNRWFCGQERSSSNESRRLTDKNPLPVFLCVFYLRYDTRSHAMVADCFERRRLIWDHHPPSKCPKRSQWPNERRPLEHLFVIRERLRHYFSIRLLLRLGRDSNVKEYTLQKVFRRSSR